ESRGFLRIGGQAELIAGAHAHLRRRELLADHPHQRSVLRSSAGDHKLAKARRRFYPRQHEPANGDADGSRRERSCRGHDVILVGPSAKAKKLARELAAKLLAARGLRRFLPKKWMPQQRLQHALDWLTARGEPPTAIVRAIEQALGHGVHHHVARPGGECNDIFRNRARRNGREVSNASKVLHDAPVTTMP